MTIRERTEAAERRNLSSRAALAAASRGRERPEPEDSLRTVFARDRDRVLHSKSFRRLKHKTQVFLATENDHFRTRLTHTLEVAQLARTISRALELNEDLTEAIALAHDLGHTPFGHAGERALHTVLREHDPAARFRHYEQSLRVVETLERDGRGLNLTWETRDGIGHHSKGRGGIAGKDVPATLEGQAVRIADRVAYLHHDTEDAIRAGLLQSSDLPKEVTDAFGPTPGDRLTFLLHDLIDNSQEGSMLAFSSETVRLLDLLKEFLFDRVYTRESDKYGGVDADGIVRFLFQHALAHSEDLPEWMRAVAGREYGNTSRAALQASIDYVAGMTDRYALLRHAALSGQHETASEVESLP